MLEISLLGEITVSLDGDPLTRFRSQKELALLAYLAHSGQTHNREAVADLLWEAHSTKQSPSNLRTALARLRKQVGDQLIVSRKSMSVIPAVHQQSDSACYQAMLAGAGNHSCAAAQSAPYPEASVRPKTRNPKAHQHPCQPELSLSFHHRRRRDGATRSRISKKRMTFGRDRGKLNRPCLL